MKKEIRNNNLIARISEAHGKFNVAVVQVVNTGLEIGEDFFNLKTGISTFNRAEKWALKQIGIVKI